MIETKIVKFLKISVATLFSLYFLVSCQDDAFFNVGESLVDGDKIGINEFQFPVKAWSVPDFTLDTLSGRYNNNPIFDPNNPSNGTNQLFFNIVGNFTSPNIGVVKAGFATRLIVPTRPFYGDEVLDSVILTIPYYSIPSVASYGAYRASSLVLQNVNSQKNYFFYGDIRQKLPLEIYRLGEVITDETSEVDGSDFLKNNFIPLNKNWNLAELIHSQEITVSFDTIFSKTEIIDSIINKDEAGNEIGKEYVYKDSILPRLNIKLPKEYFKTAIFDYYSGQVMNQENFNSYFKGLYFKAADNSQTPLMMLNLANQSTATPAITFYYRSSTTNEGKFTMSFYSALTEKVHSVNSIKNEFLPSVNAMLNNPDTIRGEKKLIIQPFGGSEVVVELINEENLKLLRDGNYLINDAYIEFKSSSLISKNDIYGSAVSLWMYKYPYGNQFNYYNPSIGYSKQYVSFYLPDQATYIFSSSSGLWSYVPGNIYGLDGIVNQNPSLEFKYPANYKMRVTRQLTELVFNSETKNVKLGLRLPMGVTERCPYSTILDGNDIKLIVKVTKRQQ